MRGKPPEKDEIVTLFVFSDDWKTAKIIYLQPDFDIQIIQIIISQSLMHDELFVQHIPPYDDPRMVYGFVSPEENVLSLVATFKDGLFQVFDVDDLDLDGIGGDIHAS